MPNTTGISALGTVTYNGFTFPPAIKDNLTIRPVPDSTGRTASFSEVTLHLECVITAGDLVISGGDTYGLKLDELLHKTLTHPGKTLVFTSIFAGVASTMDFQHEQYMFGPTPKIVAVQEIIGNQAVRIVWECSFTRHICNNQTRIVQLSVGFNFSINEEGMTVRTINGLIERTVFRQSDGGSTTGDPVDALRDEISVARINNFHRSTVWNESADKRTMQFVITDSEIPSDNPYFPYMTKMDVRESLRGGLVAGGLNTWTFRIYGSIKIAPSVPRVQAWLAFLTIVQSRLFAAFLAGSNTDGGPVTVLGPMFEFDNEIYGRQLGFSISYTILCDIQKILTASGIWAPVPGTDWAQWSISMANVQGNRGFAQVKTTASDDLIVDFCTNPNNSPFIFTQYPVPNYGNGDVDSPCPPERSSWMDYENKIEFYRETNTIQHTPISPGDASSNNQFNVDGSFGGSIVPDTPNTSLPSVVQERGQGMAFIIMRGHARRVGYKIPIPRIIRIGNTKPTLYSEYVTASHIVGWSGPCPIYEAEWTRIYRYLPSASDNNNVSLENVPSQYQPQPH